MPDRPRASATPLLDKGRDSANRYRTVL